ncbi:flagellar assembly peptidoglycan hydrolase FlgJ [Granulosicoccaceae sp. 1_MG-2023]|nr:flagellar assembly peptidoglycan hydrolase FlgJ [Granulosicoccaceae sp. 1_MG-2023]
MESLVQNGSIYTDFSGLAELKASAARDADASRREVAEQFEALFIQSMLKSMRDTLPGDELGGSDQVELYQDMFDKQLSLDMAKHGGIGIADVLERQLDPQANAGGSIAVPLESRRLEFANQLWGSSAGEVIQAYQSNTDAAQLDQQWQTRQDFVDSLMPAAELAAKRIGTEPEAVLAIAALETGWGKHVLKSSDGSSSNNLFGIKATDEDMPSASGLTQEFRDGQMNKEMASFRAYSTPSASVSDFAEFIRNNPRYTDALGAASDGEQFIQQIHKAGYATDPEYAQKVTRVMSQIKDMTQEAITIADGSR